MTSGHFQQQMLKSTHLDLSPVEIMSALTMLALHRLKLTSAFALILCLILLNLGVGNPKSWVELNWVDLLGEGVAALTVAAWTILILASRPSGRVTTLLYLGMLTLLCSLVQDLCDEFVSMPAGLEYLDNWIESGLMLCGFLILTVGIFHLHREQLALVDQLRRRERGYRDHLHIDRLTQIGDARYWRRQLDEAMVHHQRAQRPLAILVIDVDGFNAINRRISPSDGDRLLRELTDLIVINLRPDDLICRFAGDRFVAMLPGASEPEVSDISSQLTEAVRHFVFRSTQPQRAAIRPSISIGAAVARSESADALMKRASKALKEAKTEAPGQWRLAA